MFLALSIFISFVSLLSFYARSICLAWTVPLIGFVMVATGLLCFKILEIAYIYFAVDSHSKNIDFCYPFGNSCFGWLFPHGACKSIEARISMNSKLMMAPAWGIANRFNGFVVADGKAGNPY